MRQWLSKGVLIMPINNSRNNMAQSLYLILVRHGMPNKSKSEGNKQQETKDTSDIIIAGPERKVERRKTRGKRKKKYISVAIHHALAVY